MCYPEDAVCLLCGRAAGGSALCGRCASMLGHDRITGAEEPDRRAVWRYEGPAGVLVRRLKEQGVAAAADVLAADMAAVLGEMCPEDGCVVSWVPMPVRRKSERGIDHGEVLARAVAARCGLPVRPLLRRKAKDAKTQRGLGREERLRNVRGAFEAVSETPAACVLVDDVLTTGATLTECRETLLRAGARRVILLAACAAEGDGTS
ncbi:MAG: ComF family protein [Clostridia bacterium]|nr:ComF family protein [Clostridia bacterium]